MSRPGSPEFPDSDEFDKLPFEERADWYGALLISLDVEVPDNWDSFSEEEMTVWLAAAFDDQTREELGTRQALEDLINRRDEIDRFMKKNPSIKDPTMALCCLKSIERGELAAWDLHHYYPEEGRE